tara:strand:+ start:1004 stop:1339 length:336 start_codon:yes stop_codon:yes gene_type:complete
MTQDYKETLYINLFNVLSELTEHESPEVIFDRIVEDFAMSAEHHMGKADTFKSMLDTFRHDNPADTIPNLVVASPKPKAEDLYGGVSDINRQYMLEDRDNLMDFLKGIKDI